MIVKVKGAVSTVKIPVRIKASVAMVPWVSLVSIALDVPTA